MWYTEKKNHISTSSSHGTLTLQFDENLARFFIDQNQFLFDGSCSVSQYLEWPPIGKIAAHSANDMFSWYKYLIVN